MERELRSLFDKSKYPGVFSVSFQLDDWFYPYYEFTYYRLTPEEDVEIIKASGKNFRELVNNVKQKLREIKR